MPVLSAKGITFDVETEITIVGAGACGLVAALAANDAGAQVIVLERDPVPRFNSALLRTIPHETKAQNSQGLEDSFITGRILIIRRNIKMTALLRRFVDNRRWHKLAK